MNIVKRIKNHHLKNLNESLNEKNIQTLREASKRSEMQEKHAD
jgi:hypothetical protein